jgi:hypothetical protein
LTCAGLGNSEKMLFSDEGVCEVDCAICNNRIDDDDEERRRRRIRTADIEDLYPNTKSVL